MAQPKMLGLISAAARAAWNLPSGQTTAVQSIGVLSKAHPSLLYSAESIRSSSSSSSSSSGLASSSPPLAVQLHLPWVATLGGAAACRCFSTQTPEPAKVSRLGTSVKGQVAAAEAAASDPLTGSSVASSLAKSLGASRQEAFNAIPSTPKVLGFAGLIPFVAFNPAVATYMGFEDFARDAAVGQVAYGALVVSFLGAVHWGIAMTSTLSGAKSRMVQRERYTWSVFPAISAWPALMMEPGPGSLCVAILLGICYMSDRAHARLGSLPAWYMTLRGYLTTISMLSMLGTAAWFFSQDLEKMKKRMEEDDRRKAAEAVPRPTPASWKAKPAGSEPVLATAAPGAAAAGRAGAPAVPAAAGEAGQAQAPAKKGWW